MFKKFSPRRSDHGSQDVIAYNDDPHDSENIEIDVDAIHVEIDSPNLPMQSSTVKSCTKGLKIISGSLDG